MPTIQPERSTHPDKAVGTNHAVIEVRRSNGTAAFSGWVIRLGDADVAMADVDEALALARKLARTTHDMLKLPVAVMVNDGTQSFELFRIDGE